MKRIEFTIGGEFTCGGSLWRCTDVGTRTITAIRVDGVDVTFRKGDETGSKTLTRAEAEAEGWFNGPPYAVAESVFDEYDMEGCEPVASVPAP